MSRPKLVTSIAIGVLILAALFIVPVMSFAASSHSSSPLKANISNGTPMADYYTLSASITQGQGKDTQIDGGLSFVLRGGGNFFGRLSLPTKMPAPLPNERYVNTSGTILSGNVTLNLLDSGQMFFAGQGTFISGSEMTGTFQVMVNGSSVGSGVWSAVQAPGPGNQIAMSFTCQVIAGPDTKMVLNGTLVLDTASLQPNVPVSGTFNMSDGTLLPVQASIDDVKDLSLNIGTDGQGMYITALGIPYYDKITNTSGYTGTFEGPHRHDTGPWSAMIFDFSVVTP
jgi:hypothetical protein